MLSTMMDQRRHFNFPTQRPLEEAEVLLPPFKITPLELKSIVRYRLDLDEFGGLHEIARRLCVSIEKGVSAYDHPPITERRRYYGSNIIHTGYAFILFFKRYLIPEKKVSVMVFRNGRKNPIPISTTDLVVGDIVQLYAGEKVPADGLFVPGRKLSILEPSLLGEGICVEICRERPHLLAGSTVLSGSAKMLVMSVGMNTAGGQMMGSYLHSMVLSGYAKMLLLATKIREMLGVVFTAFNSAWRGLLAVRFRCLVWA